MPTKCAQPDIILACFALAYPALVYYLQDTLPPTAFVVLALSLVALRLALVRGGGDRFRPALVATAIALTVIASLNVTLAARSYPVLMSLAAASVFAVTLFQPASLVERIAVSRGNAWSEGLRAYCRKVTLLWAVWLTLNAAVAAVLAMGSDDRTWALWTGLVSYLISGLLFGIEWLVRNPLTSRASR